VTNYDQSNFSVFKSTYEDGVRPHIVPISSAKSEPESRLSHAAKIGIGVGATSFLLLCLAMVVIAFRKLRKGRDRRRLFRNRKFINFSQQSQLSNASSPRTIAMNSSTNSRRELADSGKLELNGETPPSELRNEALESIMRTAYELNEPTAPIAHELMSRDSNERIMLQNHTAKSKYKIFMTTNISRRSWTSIGTSNEVPYVKTTISSQTANRVEIDRSLPPTPISESVQCSPIQGNFGQSVTTHNGHEALSNSPDIARSVYGDIGQISSPARLNAWQRSFAHLSYSSMDLEIVIPPESTDVEIIKPLSIYNKRGRNRRNFF